jgi:hypothetical protein
MQLPHIPAQITALKIIALKTRKTTALAVVLLRLFGMKLMQGMVSPAANVLSVSDHPSANRALNFGVIGPKPRGLKA